MPFTSEMGYTEENLNLFAPITELALLRGTQYFELHQGDIPEQNACWLEGSLFIQEEAFSFFEKCFERSMASFSYFAFNVATIAEVKKLDDEISDFLRKLDEAGKREDIFSQLHSRNTVKLWDSVRTENLRSAVLTCGKAIQQYVSDTKEKGLALHVLGL